MAQQSPFLDQYNQDGIITPAIQQILTNARQRLPQLQLPSAPQPPTAASRQLAPPGQPMPSITQPQAPTANAPGLVSPGGATPAIAMPMANPDAGAHLAELNRLNETGSGRSQIHNPILRTLAGIGDIAGSAFFPAITAGIPGTEFHHNYLVKRAEGNVNQDASLAKENATTANLTAETQKNSRPPVPTNDLELWAQQNPQGKVEDYLKLKRDNAPERTETPFDVWRKQNPNAPAEEWLKTEEGTKYHAPNEYGDFKTGELKKNPNAAPDEIVSKFVAAHQAPRAPNQYEDFKTDYLKSNPNAGAAEIDKAYTAAHQQQPDRGQNYEDPATHRLVRVEPGGAIPEGAVTPTQGGSQNTLTTQQRNTASQAQMVHEQTPYMLSEIDRLNGKLGPMAGRWNDVMQGKVGMNDPDFAGLRADLLMYSSAVALMHARGRLPENLREEFDHAINNPAQDFSNLKAVMTKVDGWAVKNPGVKADGGPQGSTPTVTTKAEYDKLPKGTEYMEDGKKYRKP